MGSLEVNKKNNISFFQMAKILACVFVIVSKAIIPMGFTNGNASMAVLGLLVFCMLFAEKCRPMLPRFAAIETVFIIVSVIASICFASDRGLVWETAKTLISGLIFGYCIIRISLEERNVNWFVKAWIIAAVILMLFLRITGGYSGDRLIRLTLREDFNPNTLGVFMMIAVWCSLYMISYNIKAKKNTLLSILLYSVIIVLMLYIIIGTASRKAFISSLFIIVFWILFAILPLFKQIPIGNRIVVFALLGAILLFSYFRLGSLFTQISSSMLFRLKQLNGESGGVIRRIDLIKDAFGIFIKNPIVGVGWNNYKLYSFSGQHSHNTYVEILACTGIVGSSFAYYLLVLLLKYVFQFAKRVSNKVDAVNLISLTIAFLFINVGQILYYNSSLIMIMHLIIAICLLEKYNNRTEEVST